MHKLILQVCGKNEKIHARGVVWFGICVKKMRCVEEFQSTFCVGKAFTEGGVKNKTSPPHPGLNFYNKIIHIFLLI